MLKRGIILFVSISVGVITLFSFTYHFLNFHTNSDALDMGVIKSKQIIPWGVKSIDAPAQWNQTTGKNVKIAVMDSGFDFQHPDFGQNIKKGFNAIKPNLPPNDDYGHGTLVTGVIAAKNNSFGVVGVAPDAEVYPVKVLDKYGEGDISDIARGIDWCIENKIQIINMSFAIEEDKELLRRYIMKAIDSGIIIIASARNSYGGDVGYPASYVKVISVTAVDEEYKLSKTAPIGKVDFSAPGVGIVTTAIGHSYEEYTGTSIATPHVTGLVALIMQNPQSFGLNYSRGLTRNEVFETLRKLSKDLGENSKDDKFGEGFIQIKKNDERDGSIYD